LQNLFTSVPNKSVKKLIRDTDPGRKPRFIFPRVKNTQNLGCGYGSRIRNLFDPGSGRNTVLQAVYFLK
jgi:hypothetical protein